MFARHRSTIALYAIVAAVTAVLIEPLLAVAYCDTVDGREQLEIATVAAWAVPARSLFGGLVTWASADVVYSTCALILALMFPAVLAMLLVAILLMPSSVPDALVDAGFVGFMILGMLLSMIGSTVLGIVFRSAAGSARPRHGKTTVDLRPPRARATVSAQPSHQPVGGGGDPAPQARRISYFFSPGPLKWAVLGAFLSHPRAQIGS
jgi:hypothetical protein